MPMHTISICASSSLRTRFRPMTLLSKQQNRSALCPTMATSCISPSCITCASTASKSCARSQAKGITVVHAGCVYEVEGKNRRFFPSTSYTQPACTGHIPLACDLAHDFDAVEAHVIQEGEMQEVAIVGQSADLFCCFDRSVIGLNRVLRDDDAHIEIVCIGMESQMHRHLMDTEIGAIAHNHGNAQVVMLRQPLSKMRAMKGAERVLLNNIVQIGKGELSQFGNS